MFLVSPGIMKECRKVAMKLIATGQERGEVPFSPKKPITVTTNNSKVGDMVSF